MRFINHTTALLTLLFSISIAHATPPHDKEFDKGSQVNLQNLNAPQKEALGLLGRVWGVVKYHHPAVASGIFNMDDELFRILPKILQSKSDKLQSQVYIDWINKLGAIADCEACDNRSTDEAKMRPDASWINNNKSLSKPLQALLLKTINNAQFTEHYYVKLAQYVGNPVFTNENPYADMKYPDDGFRLLSLYRYWNMIQYFFPYKYAIGTDWNAILPAVLDDFINAKDTTQYKLAVLKIINIVSDTHANIWGDKLSDIFGDYQAPVQIRFIEGKPVVVGYYDEKLGAETGLQTGDEITHINKKPVAEVIAALKDLSPASNLPTKLRDVAKRLLRGKDTQITVKINRSQKSLTKTLKRVLLTELSTKIDWQWRVGEKGHRLINDDIGYINLGNIKDVDLEKMMQTFAKTKGIIIDIRNYPNAFMVFKLGKHLYPKPHGFAKFTMPVLNQPGLFGWSKVFKTGEINPNAYKGDVVILVNEISQSQAEYTTMALRGAPKAIVIGSTTAGADGNFSKVILPGGISSGISGIGVYYPDGTETQRVGIVPEVEVNPTIQGIIDGKDEVLDEAKRLILSGKVEGLKKK
jgi:C-terminal processing protease CtpA/Prc